MREFVPECKNALYECPLCRWASPVRNEMRHWLSGLVWETGCYWAVDGDGTRASTADERIERLSCTEEATGWILAPDKQHLSNSINSKTQQERSAQKQWTSRICLLVRHTSPDFNSCFNNIWTADCTRCSIMVQCKKTIGAFIRFLSHFQLPNSYFS